MKSDDFLFLFISNLFLDTTPLICGAPEKKISTIYYINLTYFKFAKGSLASLKIDIAGSPIAPLR
jgi:hypothetical protein